MGAVPATPQLAFAALGSILPLGGVKVSGPRTCPYASTALSWLPGLCKIKAESQNQKSICVLMLQSEIPSMFLKG